jgi:hypothetical protein
MRPLPAWRTTRTPIGAIAVLILAGLSIAIAGGALGVAAAAEGRPPIRFETPVAGAPGQTEPTPAPSGASPAAASPGVSGAAPAAGSPSPGASAPVAPASPTPARPSGS